MIGCMDIPSVAIEILKRCINMVGFRGKIITVCALLALWPEALNHVDKMVIPPIDDSYYFSLHYFDGSVG